MFSIKRKITYSIVIILFFITIFLYFYSLFFLRIIVDHEKHEDFSERLRIIIDNLEQQNKELNELGLGDLYIDDYQNDIISNLKNRYYTNKNLKVYPFILDKEGNIILHPNLEKGSNEIASLPFTKTALKLRSGSFDYKWKKNKRWMTFKTFEKWGRDQ